MRDKITTLIAAVIAVVVVFGGIAALLAWLWVVSVGETTARIFGNEAMAALSFWEAFFLFFFLPIFLTSLRRFKPDVSGE